MVSCANWTWRIHIFHYHFTNPQGNRPECYGHAAFTSSYGHVLAFGLGPAPQIFTKLLRSPYISTEANKYWNNNIPLQYAFEGTKKGGTFNVQIYNHLPSARSGFHFDHGEINFESSSRDGTSWSDSKLRENDTFIARRKSKIDSGSMSRPACQRFWNGLGADKTEGSFSCNNRSCIISTTKLSISSAATDKCFKTQRVIPRGPVLEQGVKERNTVVDWKYETLQWSVDNTTPALCFMLYWKQIPPRMGGVHFAKRFQQEGNGHQRKRKCS